MSNLNMDQILSDLDIDNTPITKSVDEQTSTDLSISTESPEISVNPDVIYTRLNNLISTGDNLLKTTQYLINSSPDAENISSAASLISSIRDVVHEFTVIHRDKLKFEQQLQLEQFKADQKEKLLKMRLEHNNTPVDTPVDMVEFSQESVINQILKTELGK